MTKEFREFQASLLDWKEIHELPNGWPPSQLLSLLNNMDVDDVSESDALEMTLLVLQDREVDDAAESVLEVVFGDSMRPGIRQNLAHDLTEERPWEEFADISQHMGIFNAVVLLHQAFPREFYKPDAVSIVVHLETASATGKGWLDAPEPSRALLLRILAEGMEDHSVLQRLFGESLKAQNFPEAESILWQVSHREAAAPVREFSMISSHQWFDPLKELENWSAKAWLG